MSGSPTIVAKDFLGRYNFSPRSRTKKDLRFFPFLIVLIPALALLYLTPYSSLFTNSAVVTTQLKARFCDGSTPERPCIFDLGLNAGQSSAVYLTHKKARVIAVEANPLLVKAGKERFRSQIESGRMRILHNGLLDPRKGKKELEFWVNRHSKFSSFVERLGCRGAGNKLMPVGDRSECHRIVVPTASCDKLIREHGTPEYMKIDIEGMDVVCLNSLLRVQKSKRPRYVSVENVDMRLLWTLANLGYTKFKVVNQALIESKYMNDPLMRGNSGLWGDKAVDQFKNQEWHTFEELKALIPVPQKTVINGKVWAAWWDLHAARY